MAKAYHLAEVAENALLDYRPYKISGSPVSHQEFLDAATLIKGSEVRTFLEAKRVLTSDGRDVEIIADKA